MPATIEQINAENGEINKKLFENIKEFFLGSEEDDDMDQADVPVRHAPERSGYSSSDSDEPSGNEGGRRNKVVNIQTTAQLQVVLVKPSAFTDAKQIADHLIAKKTVVLNLETASPENSGSLKPVANLTYIITPYNVGFIGEDLVGELENNGVFI